MPGAGVTHLAISLGNYIAGKQRQKVAVVQIGGVSGINDMISHNLVIQEGVLGFVRGKVTYYPQQKPEEAQKLQGAGFDYVIYDIASYEKARELLLSCSRSLILGSLKPWCLDTYGRFLRDNIINRNDMSQVELYSFNLEKEEKSIFEKEYQHNIKNLPFIQNPWRLQEKDFRFLESICYW